jgi:hypothetical protein
MAKHQFVALLVVVSIAACRSSQSSTSSDNKDTQPSIERGPSLAWVGEYRTKSGLCTTPDDGASCAHEFEDCLSIKRSVDGYYVELHSTQASQNTCSFRVEMKAAKDGRLVLDTSVGSLSLLRKGDAIEVSSPGVDPTALGLGFCGAHADIDGLVFPLSAKKDVETPCFSGD